MFPHFRAPLKCPILGITAFSDIIQYGATIPKKNESSYHAHLRLTDQSIFINSVTTGAAYLTLREHDKTQTISYTRVIGLSRVASSGCGPR